MSLLVAMGPASLNSDHCTYVPSSAQLPLVEDVPTGSLDFCFLAGGQKPLLCGTLYPILAAGVLPRTPLPRFTLGTEAVTLCDAQLPLTSEETGWEVGL